MGRSSPQRGWFVTFEGPDGAGKTLQARRLHDLAVEAGLPVVLTREPGGTALGEAVRDLLLARGSATADPRTDVLLFNAARAQLVAEVVAPALARGALVVSARFADSTLAYQGYGAGLPLDELRAVAAFATGGLVPDLTILLDLPVADGLRRKAGSADANRFEAELDVAFHERVRAGFLALAAAEPTRFVVVDARADPEAVFAAVVRSLERLPDLARRLLGPRMVAGRGG
ncbi:MAG TPA: dTMP kinase [Candidatus Binatia bacterium]|nr:dTMP kinase [Candidatus Binatia bacterium]